MLLLSANIPNAWDPSYGALLKGAIWVVFEKQGMDSGESQSQIKLNLKKIMKREKETDRQTGKHSTRLVTKATLLTFLTPV